MRWALLPLALLAAPAAAQDAVMVGTITRADYETYRELPFTVPAGTTRLTVRLTYDKADRTVVDLGVWDPQRFRGWSGGARDRFTLSPTDATPGYLPGTLPMGVWKVVLGVPNIRESMRSAFKVEVFFDHGDDAAKPGTAAITPAPTRGPGWYRGDFHMHDAHSDGSCLPRVGGDARVPCPLFRTVVAAAAAGLDFIAVSDHNTVSHFDGLRELQPWVAPMLLIPAVEITTFHGHTNIFGPRRFVDFRLATQKGIRALQDDVVAAGAIMSISHPGLPSGELCMGCGWTWPDTDWSRVTAIEAINGDHAEGVYAGTRFWYARLNEGHRLTGIGGSDNHNPDAPTGQSPVGRPTTVVHTGALSQQGILDGVTAGNVFIDVEGTRDRLLEVEGVAGGASAVMGEALPGGRPVTLKVHAVAVRGALIVPIVNAIAGKSVSIIGNDQRNIISLDAACGWVSITIIRDGHPLLIGNPIYLTCSKP